MTNLLQTKLPAEAVYNVELTGAQINALVWALMLNRRLLSSNQHADDFERILGDLVVQARKAVDA